MQTCSRSGLFTVRTALSALPQASDARVWAMHIVMTLLMA